MEAKNNEHPLDLNRSSYRRIKLQHRARFTIKEENGHWENCTLININQILNGVGVRFHRSKAITSGKTITIDVMPSETSGSLCITGVVKWVKQRENDCVGGIELTGPTDNLKRLLLKEALSERK